MAFDPLRTTMNSTSRARAARLLAGLMMASATVLALAANPKASQYYEDALQRFEKKDFQGAVVQLKNVIKLDNKNLSAQVLLGRALLATGAMGPAEVALSEALKLGADRAEVVAYLAQSLIGQARLPEVISDTRLAPTGLPPTTKSQVLLLQAAAHSDLGSPREALKLIEEARALDPAAAESWLAEVPIRIRSRQFKEAKAAADKGAALSPALADAVYLGGSVAHVQGQIAEALAAYGKTLQLNPAHTEALIARAGLSLDQGRLDDVLRDVAEVRRLSPSDPRAPFLAGQVSDRRGEGKASRERMAEVTALVDQIPIQALKFKPQVLILGGMAHYALGQMEKARPYLEAVLRQQADSPVAKMLGQIYLGAGNQDRAIDTLETYVKAHPNDQQALILLATANLAKGRHARAAQFMQDALKVEDTPRMRTLLGLTLVGGGKRGDALAEFENAYRRDPSQLAAGAALVDLYLGRGLPKKAVVIAETLVKRWDKDASVQTVLGRAYAQNGDADKARAAYEQALKLDANFMPAQLQLSRLDLQTNQLDNATKRLSAILAKDEKNVEALLTVAELAQRRDLPADVVRYLEKAAAHSGPRELRPSLRLVDHHLRNGNVPAATQALVPLNNKAPDTIPVLRANAAVRMANKDTPGALTYLTRASRDAGFDSGLLTQIATQQLAAKDWKGAQFTLTKALQAQPDFTPAKALLVETSLSAGDMQTAEQIVKDLLARTPNGAQAHALRGDVALAKGQVPAAIEAYKRSHQIEATPYSVRRLYVALVRQDPGAAARLLEAWIKTNKPDPELRRMLADGYARAGDFVAAKGAYQALIAVLPRDAEALNNYANVLLLTKDPSALQVAEQALALKPQAPYIISTVGWAAFQAGQADRSLQLLRDAKLRDPANVENRYFLGAVLASKGRATEARDELRAALEPKAAFAYRQQAESLLQTLK